MIKIGATSDLHGYLPEIPRDLDLLLVAGDLGPATHKYHRDLHYAEDWLNNQFTAWLNTANCPVIGIAGNHDFIAQDNPNVMKQLPWHYLEDTTTEALGLTIHGSPRTPSFGPWAFMNKESSLEFYWDCIPSDVDVLITHGPAYGFGDTCEDGDSAGSRTLRKRLTQFKQLKLHVFGHIHEAQGWSNGTSHNVSHVDLAYHPKFPVQVFEI